MGDHHDTFATLHATAKGTLVASNGGEATLAKRANALSVFSRSYRAQKLG